MDVVPGQLRTLSVWLLRSYPLLTLVDDCQLRIKGSSTSTANCEPAPIQINLVSPGSQSPYSIPREVTIGAVIHPEADDPESMIDRYTA